MRLFVLPVYALLSFSSAACLPSHLRKYQEPVAASAAPHDSRTDTALLGKDEDKDASDPVAQEPEAQVESRAPAVSEPPTIYAIAKDAYHLSLADDVVWDALVNVLLKNYNLTLVSREQGLVTTEWDSYHLNNVVYRNKISARLVRSARKGCELTIHNNVEQLTDQLAQQGVWLPSSDGQDEGLRIVKNIAILLRQPPPQAPPGNVARGLLPPVLEIP